MEFEYVEPVYDEVKNGYEIRRSPEHYELESATLLKKISEREDFAKLLNIAKPSKIADIRKALADFDDIIKSQEEIVALSYQIHQKRQEMWRHTMKTLAMGDAIRPELIKHVAENNSEKLELLKAMLDEDDRTH